MASDYITRFRADTSQHDAAIKSSTNYIKSFDGSIKKTQTSLKNMGSSLANLGFDKLKGTLGSLGDILVNSVAGSLGKVSVAGASGAASIAGLSAAASTALPAVAALAAAVTTISKSAKFEVNLDNLQALTGLDDSKMKDIAKSAINMSGQFRSSAGEIVDSMGLIGSQFPALLKDSKALTEVTKAANVLAEAGGINVVDAAKGITTVLNQMGVAASESERIINVLAAGSQQGAAGIEYLNKALEKSGTAFSSAGMSYSEAIAVLETVAPKFSSADVAGSQLNSTLLKLSTQANNNFKPSVVGMSQALDNLAKAQMTDLQLKELVGESNVTMIKTLIQGRDAYNDFTESLVDTNTAFEQMAIKMDNLPSLLTTLKNSWNGLFLSIGQSDLFQDIITGLKNLVSTATGALGEGGTLNTVIMTFSRTLDSVWNATKAIFNLFQPLRNFISSITSALNGGLIKVLVTCSNIIGELSSVFIFFINKVSGGLKTLWNNQKKIFTETAVFQWFKNQLTKVVEWWDKVISWIEDKWKAFKKWIGMEQNKFDATGTIELDSKKPDDIQIEGVSIGGISISDTEQKKLIEGTIDWYQDAIKNIDDELKGTLVSEERLTELLAKKAQYTQELLDLQIKYGLATQKNKDKANSLNGVDVNPNSYKGITTRLSELNTELDLQVYGSDKYWELVASIKELTEKRLELEVQMDTDLLTDAEKKIRDAADSIAYAERIGEDATSIFSSISRVFSEMGNATDDANNKFAQTVSVITGAISEMIPQIISLVTAKEAEAIASGTASAAKLPYPANIPAIFSIVATLGSVFASLQSIHGFANGGVISGSTSIGDYNIAKVNSGEMILNGTQQARLFHLLNSSGFSNIEEETSEVEFKISGDTLVGLLNNYNRKNRRRI